MSYGKPCSRNTGVPPAGPLSSYATSNTPALMWRSILEPRRIVGNQTAMNTTAKVQHLEGTDFQKSRGFSPAVITEGGKTVWLAGQTTTTDLEGKDISGKFDEQARTIFALINRTLKRAGGSLANLVTMTVFISDNRNGDRFVAIRREHFPDARCPRSALLTISAFARPGIVIEIQGVAVI